MRLVGKRCDEFADSLQRYWPTRNVWKVLMEAISHVKPGQPLQGLDRLFFGRAARGDVKFEAKRSALSLQALDEKRQLQKDFAPRGCWHLLLLACFPHSAYLFHLLGASLLGQPLESLQPSLQHTYVLHRRLPVRSYVSPLPFPERQSNPLVFAAARRAAGRFPLATVSPSPSAQQQACAWRGQRYGSRRTPPPGSRSGRATASPTSPAAPCRPGGRP